MSHTAAWSRATLQTTIHEGPLLELHFVMGSAQQCPAEPTNGMVLTQTRTWSSRKHARKDVPLARSLRPLVYVSLNTHHSRVTHCKPTPNPHTKKAGTHERTPPPKRAAHIEGHPAKPAADAQCSRIIESILAARPRAFSSIFAAPACRKAGNRHLVRSRCTHGACTRSSC